MGSVLVDSKYEPGVAPDTLSDVLSLVRLHGAVLCAAELTAPWGLRCRGWDDTAFYFAVRGDCRVEVPGSAPLSLAGGDLLLVAPGRRHTLRDSARSPALPFERLQRTLDRSNGVAHHGGGGTATTLVCGCFELSRSGAELVLSALPPVVHLRREAAPPNLARAIEALAGEVASVQPGARALLTRLSEVLLIQALRALIARGMVGAGWLRALDHAPIARALAAVHRAPAAPWTVASLASSASMSRSAFASQFRRLVGQTPLDYVTQWRMRRAAGLLEQGASNLGQVAAEVGYGSDESFSRAFSHGAGMTPGAYRRAQREQGTAAPARREAALPRAVTRRGPPGRAGAGAPER